MIAIEPGNAEAGPMSSTKMNVVDGAGAAATTTSEPAVVTDGATTTASGLILGVRERVDDHVLHVDREVQVADRDDGARPHDERLTTNVVQFDGERGVLRHSGSCTASET